MRKPEPAGIAPVVEMWRERVYGFTDQGTVKLWEWVDARVLHDEATKIGEPEEIVNERD